MDNMVQRVARAIHEKRRNPDANKHWFHENAEKCELSMQLAKAAIEEMRDAQPTESMMAAMWSLSYANTRESFSACWEAMIDAALKEPSND